MKIAILGAGLTGLSTAYYLTKKGFDVSIFEKENICGGLAVGFKENNWQWNLEKHYHHFFTNDFELINLAKELNLPLIYPNSLTSLYLNGQTYPFNTPLDILNFSPLSFVNRLRLGFSTVLLKVLPSSLGIKLENQTAVSFAQKLFGRQVYKIIWEPLLQSKFGNYKDQVNASWLWARIKKRTLKLGYVEGGFQKITDALVESIKKQGGKIYLDTIVENGKYYKNQWYLKTAGDSASFVQDFFPPDGGSKNPLARRALAEPAVFDIIISTLPTPVLTKIIPDLSKNYVQNLSSIPHLHALNLVLETKEPFLKNTYWLNINEKEYPFLCVVQHTNFIDKKFYNNSHLLYISNYLPFDHPYFKKTPEELLDIYLPYLLKINPTINLKLKIKNLKLFTGPFAQPVFLQNYSFVRPYGKTPIPNLYFANLDSIYPWDRGTNYALELGRKIAKQVILSQKANVKS